MENRLVRSFLNRKNWGYPITLEVPFFSVTSPEGRDDYGRESQKKGGLFGASRRIAVIYRALGYVQQVFIEPKSQYRWRDYIATEPNSPFAIKVEIFRGGIFVTYQLKIDEGTRCESITVKIGDRTYSGDQRYCHHHDGEMLINSIIEGRKRDDSTRPEELVIGALYLRLFFFEFMGSLRMSSDTRAPLTLCLDPELQQGDGYLVVRNLELLPNEGADK